MKHSDKFCPTVFKPLAYQKQNSANIKTTGISQTLTGRISFGKYGQTYMSAYNEADSSPLLKQIETVSKYEKVASLVADIHDVYELKDVGRVPYVLERMKENVNKMVMIVQPYLDQSFNRLTAVYDEIYPSLKNMLKLLSENRREISMEKIRQKIDEVISMVKSYWNRFYPVAKECFDKLIKKVGDSKSQFIATISAFDVRFAKLINYISKLDKLPIVGQLISGWDIYAKQEIFFNNPTPENQEQYDKAIYDFFISLFYDFVLAGLIAFVGVVMSTFGTIVLCVLIGALIGYAIYDVYKSVTDDKHQEYFVKTAYSSLGSPTSGLSDCITRLQSYATTLSNTASRKFDELMDYLKQKYDEVKMAVLAKARRIREGVDDALLTIRDAAQNARNAIRNAEQNFVNSPSGRQLGDFLSENLP